MRKEVIEDAEEHLANYSFGKLVKAFKRVERERHRKGCGCRSCKVRAVEDVNSWIDFVGGEGFMDSEVGETKRYGIDKNGTIFQGGE